MAATPQICIAVSPERIQRARELFQEYAKWSGLDLCFQGFPAELAGLPGYYAPPRGCLLLAETGGMAVGCVALRPLGDKVCEMKRLYIQPAWRGRGLGKALGREIIAVARRLGYGTMRLDTVPQMTSAIGLYRSLGFVPCAPYYETPLADTIFLELSLDS